MTNLSEDVDDADGGAPPGAEHVGDEEVDPARLHLAPLADPDGRQHRDQDQHHRRCWEYMMVRKGLQSIN